MSSGMGWWGGTVVCKPEGSAGGRSALEGGEHENKPNVLNTDASAKKTPSAFVVFFFLHLSKADQASPGRMLILVSQRNRDPP